MEAAGIVGNVGQRHVGIKKLQRLALVKRQVRIENGKQGALGHQFLLMPEVLLHLQTIRFITNEMGMVAATRHKQP